MNASNDDLSMCLHAMFEFLRFRIVRDNMDDDFKLLSCGPIRIIYPAAVSGVSSQQHRQHASRAYKSASTNQAQAALSCNY